MAMRGVSAWAAESVAPQHTRPLRDVVFAGIVAFAAVLEAVLRTDLVWRPASALLGLVLAAAVLHRRAHPLAAVLAAFGAISALDLATLLAGAPPVVLYSGFVVLPLAYSLFRWGSARAGAAGLVMMSISLTTAVAAEASEATEAVGGAAVLLLMAVLGVSVRAQREAREHLVARVRSEERVQIARELHDTVAHHVSAIAIQAQAGLFLAEKSSLSGARDALEVIDQEAASTLAEMRTMVSALRDRQESPDLAPRRGHADLQALSSRGTTRTRVEVASADVPVALPVAVDTALYRVAQESVTNALRHAEGATLIAVRLTGGTDEVRLSVTDDGERTAPRVAGRGFGLIGMAERVRLLGGVLDAGPRPGGGWAVHAALPLGAGRRGVGRAPAGRQEEA